MQMEMKKAVLDPQLMSVSSERMSTVDVEQTTHPTTETDQSPSDLQ